MSKSNRRHKIVTVATTRAGFEMRVFVDQRDGTALPTNWKQHASVLANMGKLQPRTKEQMNEQELKRAFGGSVPRA